MSFTQLLNTSARLLVMKSHFISSKNLHLIQSKL
uniref:Uncharacterized protein n=1 Tax=Arundo donax TaxID=35708 RepID=A0A0A9T1X8_ARUDO